jgi:hypothetical protein
MKRTESFACGDYCAIINHVYQIGRYNDVLSLRRKQEMITNRVFGRLNDASVAALPINSGFTINPFASSVPAWQLEIYEAALMQAQKEVSESRHGFSWVESWN